MISVPEPFDELEVVMTNVSGAVVLQKNITNGSALTLTGLPSGIYTLYARMPDGRVRGGILTRY